MNSDKLIYRIAEKGLTFADVADMIDIDHLALYRKLAGFDRRCRYADRPVSV